MSVIESVLGRLAQRRERVAGDYQKMVVQLANGQEPNLADLADAIAAAGKTPEQLAEDVATLQKRRELRATFDSLAATEKRRAEIKTAVDKIEARRDAANKKADEELWPLEGEELTLRQKLTAAYAAKDELSATCNDLLILERSAEIRHEQNEIERRLDPLKNERERTMAKHYSSQTERPDERDGIRAGCETHVKKLAGEIDALEAKRQALADELDDLDRRRLEP